MEQEHNKDEIETLADLDLIEDSIAEYQKRLRAKQEAGSLSIHPPHAIVLFSSKTYDLVFDPMLQDAMRERAAEVEVTEGESFDGTEVLAKVVRVALTNAFIAGYETRDRGHSFHQCRCGELDDNKLKELFGDSFGS